MKTIYIVLRKNEQDIMFRIDEEDEARIMEEFGAAGRRMTSAGKMVGVCRFDNVQDAYTHRLDIFVKYNDIVALVVKGDNRQDGR